jgi:hypothetical protein
MEKDIQPTFRSIYCMKICLRKFFHAFTLELRQNVMQPTISKSLDNIIQFKY